MAATLNFLQSFKTRMLEADIYMWDRSLSTPETVADKADVGRIADVSIEPEFVYDGEDTHQQENVMGAKLVLKFIIKDIDQNRQNLFMALAGKKVGILVQATMRNITASLPYYWKFTVQDVRVQFGKDYKIMVDGKATNVIPMEIKWNGDVDELIALFTSESVA